MKYLSLSLVLAISLATPVFADYYFYGVGDDGGELDPWWVWDVLEPFPEWDASRCVIRNNWDADDGVRTDGRDSVYDDLVWYANNLESGDLFMYQYQGHGGWTGSDSYYPDEGSTARPGENDPTPANPPPYQYDETWGWSGSTMKLWDDDLREIFADFDSSVEVIVIQGMCHAGGLIGGSHDLDTSAPATNNGLFAALAVPEHGLSVGVGSDPYYPALLTWALSNTEEGYRLEAGMTMPDWYELALDYGETHQFFDRYYWPAEDWVPSAYEDTYWTDHWGWEDSYLQLRPVYYSSLDDDHDYVLGTPDPGTIALFGLGLLGLGAKLRRCRES